MELETWREFYVLYPFDDMHRFHRPAAMVASSHPGMKDIQQAIDGRLKWLQPKPVIADFGDADMRTIQALGGSPPPGFHLPGM